MKCPNCEYECLVNSQFCDNCGTDLKGTFRPYGSKAPASPMNTPRYAPQTDMNSIPAKANYPTPAPPPVPCGMAPQAPFPQAPPPQAPPPTQRPPMRPSRANQGPRRPNPNPPAPLAAPLALDIDALKQRAYAALEAVAEPVTFYIEAEDTDIGRGMPEGFTGARLDLRTLKGGSSVSRVHAHIFRSSGEILLEDLGSVNGTFLNNERLLPSVVQPLYENDVIRFGAVAMTFHCRQ